MPSNPAPAPDERSAMTKYKLEYIWLDGYTPVPNLRGKTQIKEFDAFPTLEQLPLWGFDGSSTNQAEGRSSDCVLKPVRIVPDCGDQSPVHHRKPERWKIRHREHAEIAVRQLRRGIEMTQRLEASQRMGMVVGMA